MNHTHTPAIGPLELAKITLLQLRGSIVSREESFLTETLPFRLKMGLACLKAFEVFIINPGKGGRPKKTVTRDGLLDQGFEGWLKTGVPWLKKSTAYKYMTAVRGLGLDYSATEEAVDAALVHLHCSGPVTLKLLCDMAADPLAPAAPAALLEQTEFEFIRAGLSAFRVEAEALILMADRLRQIPDAHRAACARSYRLLRELTGTDWGPTDTPDPLAGIDPDTLAI